MNRYLIDFALERGPDEEGIETGGCGRYSLVARR